MSEVKHKIMPKFICLFWPKQFVAITLTSKLICYRNEEWMKNEGLRKHEAVHCRQMEENGWLKFMIKYLCYSMRYGYWKNPYEVEARSESGYPS